MPTDILSICLLFRSLYFFFNVNGLLIVYSLVFHLSIRISVLKMLLYLLILIFIWVGSVGFLRIMFCIQLTCLFYCLDCVLNFLFVYRAYFSSNFLSVVVLVCLSLNIYFKMTFKVFILPNWFVAKSTMAGNKLS